jgi:pimeloyl-ACP methyl ester carboxylesterase
MKGFKEIESKLHRFKGPVQIIYGENDKILPRVARTMSRVKDNLPQASILSLPNCGHFLQEDEPLLISEAILAFMKAH